MNIEDKNSSLSSLRIRFFSSHGWRVATLVFLGALLLVPLSMIDGLLDEREGRRAEAASEVALQWGGKQGVIGPFLSVPVEETVERKEKVIVGGELQERIQKVVTRANLFLQPQSFRFESHLDSQLRYRGIFRTPVYSSSVKISGDWLIEEAEAYGWEHGVILWEEADLVFRVTDQKGVSQIESSTSGVEREARPVYSSDGLEWVGLDCPVRVEAGESVSFELSFELQGSSGLRFLPVGRRGKARMSGSWEDPSFVGARLPNRREVSESGFEAVWSFGEFGRNFPQFWIEREGDGFLQQLSPNLSGVDLLDPIDGYRLSERSLKYGILFVVLGFVVFFVFELLCDLRLHAMHYLLVGAAQAMFFLLLLALSEVLFFSLAYLLAASASSLLVTGYAASVLGSGSRSLWVLSSMVGLYGSLFVILREQDYALLAGSGVLFTALAVFMLLTRNLDWAGGGRKAT